MCKSTDSQISPETYPFVKKLAANDRPTRDQAVESLQQFLHTKEIIDISELNKLWKGLFFSMWFSDRPRTQQNLANDLADLVQVLSSPNFLPFISSFWTIMAREWDGIDQHRIDKFYLLIRRYHAATLRRLKQENWDEDLVAGYKRIMAQYPLNVKDGKIPNALRLHMFDIYLDEIERVAKESGDEENLGDEIKEFPMEDLLGPVRDIANNSPLKHIRHHAKKNVLDDKRLVEWGIVEVAKEEESDDSDDEWGGIE